MIIDSFIFNDELDILEFRLELLYRKVDKFVLVEADCTHTGIKKPFYYQENKNRFKRFEDKIHHYMFSPDIDGLNFESRPEVYDTTHACWKVETQQRNAIADVLEEFPYSSMVIISDCDEIPSWEAIEFAGSAALPVACQQDLFYYNLSNFCAQEWRGSIFTTVGHAITTSPQGLRDLRNTLPAITDGGWHLSWFGDISKKLSNQAHQELNIPEFNNEEHIKKCVEQRKDLFNRNIDFMEVGDWFFPEYFNTKLKGRFRG